MPPTAHQGPLLILRGLSENHPRYEKVSVILEKLLRYRVVCVETYEPRFGEVPTLSTEITGELVIREHRIQERFWDVLVSNSICIHPENLPAVSPRGVDLHERLPAHPRVVVDVVLIPDYSMLDGEAKVV